MSRARGWLVLLLLLIAPSTGWSEPPPAEPATGDFIERIGKIAPDEPTIEFVATIDPRTGLPSTVRGRDPAAPVGDNRKPLPGGLVRLTTPAPPGANQYLAFSPDERTLVTSHCSGTVRLWDTVTGLSRGRLRNCHDNISSLAFSPDGKLLAIAAGRHPSYRSQTHRFVRLFDLATRQEVRSFAADGTAHRVAFSPDGKTLAVGGLDGSVQLHPIDPGERPRDLAQGTGRVVGLAFSPDGKSLLVWYEGDHARWYDIATGREHGSVPVLGRLQGQIAFSADGRRVALGNELDIRVWDVTAAKLLEPRLRGSNSRQPLALSADGQTLATVDLDGIHLWDVDTGKERHSYPQSAFGPVGVALSPDGRMVASTDRLGATLLWDAAKPTSPPGDVFLSHGDIANLGRDLPNESAGRAFFGLGALTTGPRRPLWLWRDSLRPPEADPQRIAQLIADLDSNRFSVRQRASQSLEALGNWAVPPLRTRRSSRPPLEVLLRVERILSITDVPIASDRLRTFHGVRLLEQIGNPAARQLLQQLADGPGARTAAEARAALKRWASEPR